MPLYTAQFQGPVMVARGEKSCSKLTFVLLVIDLRTVRLQQSRAVGSSAGVERSSVAMPEAGRAGKRF